MEAKTKEVKDKYSHLVDILKDRIECPVCLEIPINGPIPICPNGHLVCSQCKTGSCPTCRVPMGNSRSLLAVAIIENIEHKCKFGGCEEVFPVDKLGEHVKTCKYRTVSCPHDLCDVEIELSKLLVHVKKGCSYNRVPAVIEDSDYVSLLFNGAEQEGCDWSWKLNIFSYLNMIFAVFPQKNDNFYFFSIVMFDSEKECSKFNIEIVVHEEVSSMQDSEFSFKFCGKPTSIDVAKNEQKYCGLAVSNSGMNKILEKSEVNAFQLSFNITK